MRYRWVKGRKASDSKQRVTVTQSKVGDQRDMKDMGNNKTMSSAGQIGICSQL